MGAANDIQHSGCVKISLFNEKQEIAAAADKIDEFCAERGVDPAAAYAVNLSIDELLTNTISYGYDDSERHRIDLMIRLDGNTIIVEISDDGRPFEPTGVEQPDTDASVEDRAIGGLGIFLVREMMDSFQYRRHRGRNIVTLTKHTGDTRTENEK